MKLMGIDCSTNSLAFSVFEDGKLIQWGEIGFGKGDIWHRMNNASRSIGEFAKEDIFDDIDKVYFEAASYIQNKRTVILLAYAFGAAISPFIRPGVEAQDVTPMEWQSFIGNKAFNREEKAAVEKANPGRKAAWYKDQIRKMRKQRNIDFVKKTYGIDVDSHDIADAICIGHYGANK